jgi:dipeptidase E
MAHIVAIGGGSMKDRTTFDIDRYIVKLCGKKEPRVLLIPTATYDNPERFDIINDVYGQDLGCTTDVLYLLKTVPSHQEIQKKLQDADIIYVSGGNTLKLMRKWRSIGLDQYLKDIWENSDKVLCGSSAGALCWFDYGHSDSMFYYHPEKWEYIRVKCLGFVSAMCCPHYLKENRDASYKSMVRKYGGRGIALDDAAAFHIHDKQFKVVSAQPGAFGYKLNYVNSEIIQTTLDNRDFQPLSTWYAV